MKTLWDILGFRTGDDTGEAKAARRDSRSSIVDADAFGRRVQRLSWIVARERERDSFAALWEQIMHRPKEPR